MFSPSVAPPEYFLWGGQIGPVKILEWHTKMVLLQRTQIQLQSVAVYCIPLDSCLLKRNLKFEKHTNISEKHKNVSNNFHYSFILLSQNIHQKK